MTVELNSASPFNGVLRASKIFALGLANPKAATAHALNTEISKYTTSRHKMLKFSTEFGELARMATDKTLLLSVADNGDYSHIKLVHCVCHHMRNIYLLTVNAKKHRQL